MVTQLTLMVSGYNKNTDEEESESSLFSVSKSNLITLRSKL